MSKDAFSFFTSHFSPQLTAAIAACGYTAPTPIQAQAVPHVMEGRDVLGLAQTGTGKTAAFALPILERLQKTQGSKVEALIIAPTRELADQIDDHLRRFARGSIRTATIYGGVPMAGQVRALRSGARVVTACPGRLLDHIEQRTIDLRALQILVLDEADHMFDMGFLPTLRKILKSLPAKRQNLLFSATMPREIRTLAMETLSDPVTVQTERAAPATTVAHALYPVQSQQKAPLLLKLLKDASSGSVLVFCRTKHRAKKLASQLSERGHRATCLQGNLSQSARRRALEGFRDGSFRIMVATDIAARGIDVSSVSHVINFDIPDTVEAYIHRIGRTGRAARSGDAYTLVTDEDHQMVRAIERVLGSRIERRASGYAAAAA